MKKVYAMTALALAVGLSASAMPMTVDQKLQTAKTEAMVSVPTVGTGVAVSPVMASAPAKAISSTKDLEGVKQWNGILVFGQKEAGGTIINGPQTGVSFAEDARDTRITIANFPISRLNLRLDVDLAKKEVYFQNGTWVGNVDTEEGSKEVNIYVRKNNGDIVYDDASGLYKYSEQPEECGADEMVVGKILDNGDISFEGYTMMAQSPDMVEQGSVYLMLNTANIVFQATPWNTPVEAEYNYVGLGQYKDAYFAPLFKDPSIVPVNKKAEIYTKNVGSDLMIAVKNPYKNVEATLPGDDGQTFETNDFWKEAAGLMYQDASGDGWVLFQVMGGDMFKDYPGLTAVIEMVPSGMEADQSEDGDGSDVQMYYLYNAEGNALYGSGEEGLLMLVEGWAAGTGATKFEYTKLEDKVITIHNTAVFGMGTDPAGGYWWQNGTRVEGGVTMPEGWTLGVNDIVNDSENAPVKYYNLQGMELSAPVKGQLTIMKQGKKSIKFIAR